MKHVNILKTSLSITNHNEVLVYLHDNFDSAINRIICFANVYTTVYAYEHQDYENIQNNSFLTLADGKPLSVLAHKKGYKEIERITGPDFLESILCSDLFSGYNHYFYGNTKEHLDKFICYIENKYPNVNICGYEPSVFRDLSEEEKEQLKHRIKESKADFVWIAIGAPKQDYLANELSRNTNTICIGVGGAFDVISGVIPRAPKFIQYLSLEWLYRLINEPKRLFKKYLVNNTKFIYYVLKESISKNGKV